MRIVFAMIFFAASLGSTAFGFHQISISLGINIERQPVWGPTGYDYVEYYYLPDIEVYYFVPDRRFIYYDNGRWINSVSLPYRFRSYDLYASYKIVVNEREPYRRHSVYRERYHSYRGRRDQQHIRDSRDTKYFINKGHPEYKNRPRQQPNDRAKDRKKNTPEKRERK